MLSNSKNKKKQLKRPYKNKKDLNKQRKMLPERKLKLRKLLKNWLKPRGEAKNKLGFRN